MYKKFILKEFPSKDFPQDLSCFDLKQFKINDITLEEQDILIQIYWVSLDPLLRTWISGARSYLQPVVPGSPIPGFSVGKVVKQNQKKSKIYQVGDWVVGMLQWSQYVKIKSTKKNCQKVPIEMQQNLMHKYLSIYGPTGFTAFYSIKTQIQPFKIKHHKQNRWKNKQQINILISSVAGGVGITLCEYLSKMGYKNIYGISGSNYKCETAQKHGCKATINYKNFYKNKQFQSKQFQQQIFHKMNNQLIDIYYQNVGQQMFSSALKLMANHSKIIMCGALATYNNWNQKSGILNYQQIILKRIQVKGILYYNINPKIMAKAFMEMVSIANMNGVDIIVQGIQKLPETYKDLIQGKFIGKPIVRLM